MRPRLRVAEPAKRQAKLAAAWWRANRPSARGLFRRELSTALGMLPRSPAMGARYDDADIPGLRRVLLPETRYHVYYIFDEAAAQVTVLAIWSTLRGEPPPIPRK